LRISIFLSEFIAFSTGGCIICIIVLRLAGVPLPASALLHLSSVILRFSSRTREEIQININDELRTHLSTRLSSVSLRCSGLATGETQIHIKGFLRAPRSNGELRSYLREEGLRELRLELSSALVTLHVLGKELSSCVSSNLGILKLSSEFSSRLGLHNVLPASEDDVIHMLRRVSCAISAILLELNRGNLRLRCGQFVVDLSPLIQQARRRRFLELESKRAAGLKIANSLRAPRSLLSTSKSIFHQPTVLPDLGAYSADSDTQGMYSLCEISRSPERGVAGSNELPKRLNDQNGWKRLHVALAAESACLWPAER
jgi:hypothetical protein